MVVDVDGDSVTSIGSTPGSDLVLSSRGDVGGLGLLVSLCMGSDRDTPCVGEGAEGIEGELATGGGGEDAVVVCVVAGPGRG